MTTASPTPSISPPDAAEPAIGLSEGARGGISLAIFIHLFAVAIATLAGARGQSSAVVTLNDRLVRPYSTFLNLGQYSFPLTYAQELDFEVNCDVLLNWRRDANDNAAEPPDLKRLPLYDPTTVTPGIRRARYTNLARNVAYRVGRGNDAVQNLLPRAITQHLLDEAGIKEGEHRFRCFTQTLAQPPWVTNPQPGGNQVAFRSNIVMPGGRAEMVEVTTAGQAAPVDTRRRSPGVNTTKPKS